MRRGAGRATYDRAELLAILDAGAVAHVGVATDDGPVVLPMAYGHDGEWLYLHGALANALLGEGAGAEVCATVTVLDGLVVARTPFHSSMDYRCVVVRGRAEEVTDPDAKVAALRTVNDHVAATWADQRPPSPAELRRTRVVRVPLAEASGKVRAGGPGDDPEDVDGPHWGGHVPIESRWGAPVPADDLPAGIAPPAAVVDLAGRPAP